METVTGTLDAATRRRGGVAAVASENALLVPVVALFGAFLLVLLPNELWSDGWLALAAGRDVVAHGLPSYDTLTVWAHGRQWVDQQWLAQLAFYGAYSAGGLRLALVLHAFAATAAFAASVAVGRARGGSSRSVLAVAVLVFFGYGFFALVMRPQSLAYPLFVCLFWLLVRYSRGDHHRLWLVAPVVVLWASLHGSVALASLLIVVAVVNQVARRRHIRRVDGGLLAAALLLPFASPYALSLPHYYERVLLNPEFGRYVAEWGATTPSILTYPFYALALGVLVLLGRNGRVLTLFERASLVVLLALAIKATRGVPWFCLAALMTTPALLSADWRRDYDRLRGLRCALVVGGSAVAVVAALISVFTKAQARFQANYPPAAASTVVRAAGPHGRVYANETYADWLLLTRPSLRGRIAFDARFELLSTAQLDDVAAVRVAQEGWRQVLRGYEVAVVATNEADLRRALERAGWTRLFHGVRFDVFRR